MILQYFLLMALVCHSSVQMVHFCWQRNPTNHRNALFLDIPSSTVLRAHFKTSSLLHQMGAWWIEPQYKVAQGVIVAAWRCLKRPHKTIVLFVTMAVIFWFSFIKIFKGLPICCFYGVQLSGWHLSLCFHATWRMRHTCWCACRRFCALFEANVFPRALQKRQKDDVI